MNNLYEVLEICLQDIEKGAEIETVLFRYPDLADELRPILEASMNAKSMASAAPSADVMRRNRAKILQHAAQMREGKAKPSRRIWFASLRRIAVTLAVVVTLFVSGTSLVGAASTTLPGDNLYPVKRTWEDVLLLFTFNLQEREALAIEHENERLYELMELFAEGRSAEVDFAGIVTSQNGNEWIVSPGVPVVLSAQTEVREGPIVVGSAVRVRGHTQSNGVVLAERIRLLSSDAKLPDIGDEPEIEEENHEGPSQPNEDNSGPGSEGNEPNVEETETPESESNSNSNDESLNDGSGSDSSNSNGSDDSNTNDSSNSGNDNSDSNSNDDGTNDNSGDDNNNSNDDSGNDNSDDSGGEDNSGSGGGGGDD
jgi:hypothetical protein